MRHPCTCEYCHQNRVQRAGCRGTPSKTADLLLLAAALILALFALAGLLAVWWLPR